MHKFKTLFIAATLLAMAPSLALAAIGQDRNVEGIAAIVNDQVISLFDVDQRVDLFFATSGIQRSPEMRDRIRAQVLRSLVDEKLQMQEAERVEIAIDPKEVDQNIERMAGSNQMTMEGIKAFLSENGIEDDTLKGQIEAELAWSQFVRRSFGGRLKIGDQEIDEQYEKAMRSLNEPRFKVSEILLNIEAFANEQEINTLSQEIVRQLQAGVDFAAVARQFSIAPSAVRGGELGWVSTTQVNRQLGDVLKQMQPGQISPPVKTSAGIYILALAERRDGNAKNPLKNQFDVLTVGFQPETDIDTVTGFVDSFKTCRRAQTSAKDLGASVKRSGLQPLGDLPGNLHRALANLEAGQLTAPQSTADGAVVYIVCDRKDDQGTQVSREAISDSIYSQRIGMMARRHLRDLRREAVVEYR